MNAFAPFNVARLPEIRFGSGVISELPSLLMSYGQRIILVTGKQSFQKTPHWLSLQLALKSGGAEFRHIRVEEEPSPQLVDKAVNEHKAFNADVVAAIGGGSVMDAAKAIAGLLITENSVMDHLEGVGKNIPYQGPSVPLICVPTTAGTGSEATKNAVLSARGEGGFKKSFRDNQLVAQLALVDPDLLATCSKELIAADGMDAFTQLLESYVSSRASPFTDALAASGLQSFQAGFWSAFKVDENVAQGYQQLAYASLNSGITLAQAGLGSVHGLASPLGAFFPIPHGVVCGTLVAEATRVNIAVLRERDPDGAALRKYAEASILLTGEMFSSAEAAQDGLVDLLTHWTSQLQLPKLSHYGVSETDIPRIVANARGGSMQTNPILLTDDEIARIVRARL